MYVHNVEYELLHATIRGRRGRDEAGLESRQCKPTRPSHVQGIGILDDRLCWVYVRV